jgi:hypothetical protein
MESSPQIYEFHMILSNGRRIKKSIKHIQLIHQHIIQYGLFTIHTITFNFLHSNLSPYMTHNITYIINPPKINTISHIIIIIIGSINCV